MNNSSIIVSAGSINGRSKVSKGFISAIDMYECLKSAIRPPFSHAFISGLVAGLRIPIPCVLGACAGPNVAPAIIKTVPVPMVNTNICVINPKQKTVHFDLLFSSAAKVNNPDCIKSAPAFNGMPFPLIQKIIILIVNHYRQSIWKWYQSHSLKKKSALQSEGLVTNHSRGRTPDAHALQGAVLN